MLNPPNHPPEQIAHSRPSLSTILRDLRNNPSPQPLSRNPTHPQHSKHLQPTPLAPHRCCAFTRPPSNRDVRGTPWCDCCTTILSDDDDTSTGLRDSSIPGTRYMLREDHHTPPSHSNQHLDYIGIFRSNAEFHTAQRDAKERYQARTSILPFSQPTSTYTNTACYTDLGPTIARLQYGRYRERGGRQARGSHHSDHAYNSPCRSNMTPGTSYRRWFHDHISRNHYSLGEATDHYNDWLVDPQYGPDPPPRHKPSNHSSSPSPPHIERQTPAPIPAAPSPSTDQDNNDTSHNSAAKNHARAQTIVQDVHTSPDDANAVLDSGAMMTTAPRRLLTINTEWEANIRPAPPGTAIRYGNMETEPVEEVSQIGSYPLSIVPNRYRTALVCVHDIVSAGHVVTFTNTETLVSDIGGAYTLRIPRIPDSREWRVPLHLLQRLTELRAAHPLHNLQQHNDYP